MSATLELAQTLADMSQEGWRDRFARIIRQLGSASPPPCRQRKKEPRLPPKEVVEAPPLVETGPIGKGRWAAWHGDGLRPAVCIGGRIVGDYATWIDVGDGIRARVENFGFGRLQAVRCICGGYSTGRANSRFCSRKCKVKARKARLGARRADPRWDEVRCKECGRPSKPRICARCQWGNEQADEMWNALHALNREIRK